MTDQELDRWIDENVTRKIKEVILREIRNKGPGNVLLTLPCIPVGESGFCRPPWPPGAEPLPDARSILVKFAPDAPR